MEPEPMDAQERPGKGNDLLMMAIATLQPQKPVGENAAIEKGVEFSFDVIGQPVCGFRFNLGEKSLDVVLDYAVERGVFGPMPFVMNASRIRLAESC